jgi:hypothetical protein
MQDRRDSVVQDRRDSVVDSHGHNRPAGPRAQVSDSARPRRAADAGSTQPRSRISITVARHWQAAVTVTGRRHRDGAGPGLRSGAAAGGPVSCAQSAHPSMRTRSMLRAPAPQRQPPWAHRARHAALPAGRTSTGVCTVHTQWDCQTVPVRPAELDSAARAPPHAPAGSG